VLSIALAPNIAVGSLEAGGRSSWLHGSSAVTLHPSSVLHGVQALAKARPLLLFQSLNKTTSLYMRDVSSISPAAALLFGGEVEVHHAQGAASLGCGARLGVDAQTALLLRVLRLALARELDERMATPSAPVRPELLRAVRSVLLD